VTLVIPPSVDVRTFSRYAGLSSDDPLCEPSPRFYRLENMLTLDDDASNEFRNLNVWLEETVRHLTSSSLSPPPSTCSPSFSLSPLSLAAHYARQARNGEYQIVTWHSNTFPTLRRYLTAFTTTDFRVRPMPSVHYLRLHAACARVAHKSGAATYIEELARDIARLTVLAEDGSSAGVLAAALTRIAAA
jgi:hypothetical protein